MVEYVFLNVCLIENYVAPSERDIALLLSACHA